MESPRYNVQDFQKEKALSGLCMKGLRVVQKNSKKYCFMKDTNMARLFESKWLTLSVILGMEEIIGPTFCIRAHELFES